MFHGRKKQTIKALSEDEKILNAQKLEKILIINQQLLAKRDQKDYSAQALQLTEKFAQLSPDFTTLWNYRREIIQAQFLTIESDKSLEMIKYELDMLIKLIKRSPKSYTLWFHRQWCIENGLVEENKNGKWQSGILEGELALCSKMLQMDERNFHCWNYRLWVVETYISKIQTITDDQLIIENFVQNECDMAEKIIKKNFSNYSAWHYRGKLMPKVYQRREGQLYIIPIERIKQDLDMLKHAFFTDPNDQSPWNYHEWLISLITPIQVVALKLVPDSNTIEIGLSHQVKNFDHLDINITDEQGEILKFTASPKGKRDISSTWILQVDDGLKKLMVLYIKMRPSTCPQDLVSCETVEGHKLFRNFFTYIKDMSRFELADIEVWQQDQTQLKTLNEILAQQLVSIKELTDFESGLQFALLRQLELIRLQYELFANPYYNDSHGGVFTIPTMMLEDEIDKLTDQLKLSCKEFQQREGYFEKVHKSFRNIKIRWDNTLDTGSLLLPVYEKKVLGMILDRHFGHFFN